MNGPGLRAVLEISPSALRKAAELDEERAESGKRGKLHGIPVLLKVLYSWSYFLMLTICTRIISLLLHLKVTKSLDIIMLFRQADALVSSRHEHYRGVVQSTRLGTT